MNKFKLSALFALLLFAPSFFLPGCKKEEDQAAKDDQIIRDYITNNNLVAEKTASGIYYIIDEPGNSQHPTLSNDVRVTYSGFYTDGEIFDGNTLTFGLWEVIQGWQEGMQLFGKGGKGMLLIPSRYGYGSSPPSGIRADAMLIFNVHLIDIK